MRHLSREHSTLVVQIVLFDSHSLRHVFLTEVQSLGTNDKMPAKMHIRRPGRDNWSYIGRVTIFQELTHKSPVVGESNRRSATRY